MLNIITVALYVAFIVLVYFDFKGSLKFPYYGLEEGNRLFRDDYGNFSLKKGITITGAIFLIALFISIFFKPIAGALLLSVAIVKFLFLVVDNRNAMKYNRKKQVKALTDLETLINDPNSNTAYFWSTLFWKEINGRIAYNLFRYIYIEGKEANEALPEIRARIESLALQPKEKWFE